MGKAARRVRQTSVGAPVSAADLPVVGQREPCPCGSRKKYKLCHGRAQVHPDLGRTFEGLPEESEWVALRELIPAGTASIRVLGDSTEVRLSSILPMMWPALRRRDGSVFLGLQSSGPADPSRNLAAALAAALVAEPGEPVTPCPAGSARLQEVLDLTHPLQVEVHPGFDYWTDTESALDPGAREALEQANHSVIPTERVPGVTSAYWCQAGEKRHLRWVLPQPEDELLDGLARLHAVGATKLGPDTRYIGAFRAHGLLVPVWDLAADATAEGIAPAAAEFQQRLTEAAASTTALSAAERGARAGVLSRQLTLR